MKTPDDACIRCFTSLNPDPFNLFLSTIEQLQPNESVGIRIHLKPVSTPQMPGYAFDLMELEFKRKLAAPLWYLSLTLGGYAATQSRADAIYLALDPHLGHYASPTARFRLWDEQTPHTRGTPPIPQKDALNKLQKVRPDYDYGLVNSDELVGLVHLPHPSIETPILLRNVSSIRPVPDDYSKADGFLFGENTYRDQTKPVRLPHDLRSRHTYIVGASGSGKSTLLSNLIRQDLEAGAGFALLDPHGDLVQDIMPFIPEHRVEDVVYFDPRNKDYVTPINILAAQPGEEQLIADAVILTFRRLAEGWGPRMDYILRNVVYTLLATGGKTFADIHKLLVDPNYRASVVQTVTTPMLQTFWSAEFPNYPKTATDPITNKFGIFLNPFSTTTHIFTQTDPTPDFFKIMQEKKVFLANLSQGQIGTETSQLLGTFIISQIQLAAMRRANVPPEERSRFTLYVDEFQNYTEEGSAFEKMLSEARKYNLALVLANQYSAQLSGKVRDAIFGNVFTTVAFRVGVDDARIMQKAMPLYSAEDLQNFDIGEAVMRCGKAEDSFNLKTFYDPNKPEPNFIDAIVEHSRKAYSIPVSQILEQEQQQAKATQQQPAPEGEDPY